MITVNQLLEEKSDEVLSTKPAEPVFNALKIMADKNIGALPVIEDGKLVGIFSERDYARNSILRGNSCVASTVGQLMTNKVFYVSPDDTSEECMTVMTEKHIRHLPVLKNDQVIGMLTLGDVVKEILSHKEKKIRELEKSIGGNDKG